MKFVYAVFIGVATAASATLIHQTLPPLGAIVGIVGSYIAIWWVGRYTGKRHYKFFALMSWLAVIAKAGSFGVGNELLIQGDNPGSALLALGFIAGIFAVARRP
jgi:hypothetical protein